MEKVGIKPKRFPEMTSTFGPKSRNRKTNKTHWVYGSPPFDEPVLAWNRIIHSKGAFNLVAEGPFDEDIDTIMKEFDVAKRANLTSALGQEALRWLLRRDDRDEVDHVGDDQEGRRLAVARLRTAREQLRVREPGELDRLERSTDRMLTTHAEASRARVICSS